jgi:hypothetical protein
VAYPGPDGGRGFESGRMAAGERQEQRDARVRFGMDRGERWRAGQIGRGNGVARGCGMLLNSEFIIFLLNFDKFDKKY